jgi:uncharacterized protein DUF6477
MSDLRKTLNCLKRPRMLVGAARKGLTLYRRDRDLPRIAGGGIGTPAQRLLEREDQLERTRREGDVTYSVARHIAVLTALLAEASLA